MEMEAVLPDPDPQQFESWCSARGIYRAKICYGAVGEGSAAGQGLFAREAIARDEEFVSVPVGAIITESVARASEVGRAVQAENEEREQLRGQAAAAGDAALPHRISARTLLYCYLIHARHALSSPFRPWLVHAVPRSYDLPLTWSAAELEMLRGTNLGEAVPHRLGQLRRKYAHAIPALTARNPQLFPADVFTWENFLWAHCTYSSRGFPAQLADPSLAPSSSSTLPGAVPSAPASAPSASATGPTISLGGGGGSPSGAGSARPTHSTLGCLIPYLDLTNHRFKQPITWLHTALPGGVSPDAGAGATAAMHPHDRALRDEAAQQAAQAGTATVVLLPLQARVSLRAGEDIAAGAEILNNYGAKANEELLFGYGFTLPENTADELTLALGARAVTPEKLALLRAAGSGSGSGTGSGAGGSLALHQHLRLGLGVPDSLVQVLRACAMDEPATQSCSALWLPQAAPELLAQGTPGATSAAAASASAALRQVLSAPCHRTEVTLLLTLRSLLFGRLKRLQLSAPSSETVPPEHALVPDQHSGLLRLRTVRPGFFRRFDAADQRAREENHSSNGGRGNYHVECALNYRLGQRRILEGCLTHADGLLAQAASRAFAALDRGLVLYAPAPVLPAGTAPSPSSAAAVAPRKKRKTGRGSSQVSSEEQDASRHQPSWAEMLAEYNSWLVNVGGQANADWSGGRWRLESDCTIPDAAPTGSEADFASSPLLLAMPLSALVSAETIAATPSFEPCVELVEGLQEEQVATLFLLHERAKGRESRWHPWLQLAAAIAPVSPKPTGEEEDISSQLGPRESALFDLHGQLFPALSEAYPELFSPLQHTWEHFAWAARLVHDQRVSFVAPHAGAGRLGAVLPVPAMPVPAPLPLSVVEALEGPAPQEAGEEEATADEGMLVYRSLVSLQRGSVPTLCAPVAGHAWPDLLDYSVPLLSRPTTAAADAATSASDSNSNSKSDSNSSSLPLPLPCATLPFGALLDFHAEVLEAGGAPFGLAVRALTRAHRALWARVNVDEATAFVLTDSLPVPPLLFAVVRSLFLSSSQLAARASGASSARAADSSSSSATPTVPLTGALVDDSDEEEDEDTKGKAAMAATVQRQQEEEEEGGEGEEVEAEAEAAEEEEDDSAPALPVDEPLLEQAVRRFLQAFRHNQAQQLGEEGEGEEEGATATAAATATATDSAGAAFPRFITVTPQQLRRVWRQEQLRILTAPLPA